MLEGLAVTSHNIGALSTAVFNPSSHREAPAGERTACPSLAAGVAAAACAAAVTVGCDRGPAQSDQGNGTANTCASLVAGHPLAPPPVNPDVPVLGYNPYNTFGTSLDQDLIVSIMHAMIRNGMRAAATST